MTSNLCVADALHWATALLTTTSSSAALDAHILLAHTLAQPRSTLYAHPEYALDTTQQQRYRESIQQRHAGMPVAYLTGTQEFWSLPLRVNTHTLIPRPETELLVETTLHLLDALPNATVADLGTGSGAIALALAHERKTWSLHASDNDALALQTAQHNAAHLQLNNITFALGAWCAALPDAHLLDAIVSNPPYLAAEDDHLNALRFEPRAALVANNHGLADLHCIIVQASQHLRPHGWLLLEHGSTQAPAVHALFSAHGYTQLQLRQDLAGLPRVSMGQKSASSRT